MHFSLVLNALLSWFLIFLAHSVSCGWNATFRWGKWSSELIDLSNSCKSISISGNCRVFRFCINLKCETPWLRCTVRKASQIAFFFVGKHRMSVSERPLEDCSAVFSIGGRIGERMWWDPLEVFTEFVARLSRLGFFLKIADIRFLIEVQTINGRVEDASAHILLQCSWVHCVLRWSGNELNVLWRLFFCCRHNTRSSVHGFMLLFTETVRRRTHISQLDQGCLSAALLSVFFHPACVRCAISTTVVEKSCATIGMVA